MSEGKCFKECIEGLREICKDLRQVKNVCDIEFQVGKIETNIDDLITVQTTIQGSGTGSD